MSSAKNSINRSIQLGIGFTLIALSLAGCGGGKSSNTPTNTVTPTPTPSVIPTASIKITPMKGQFSTGTSVKIKRAKDSVEVGTCLVDATGSCSADIKTSETGPFLIEAGIAGDKYFDESTGALATVPANTTALRALIPNATAAVGVTALTEMAVGQIEGNTGGIAAAKTTDVIAANATIGSQFGVPDPLVTPSVIGAGTSAAKLTGGNNADDYALKLAGLAKLTKAGQNPIHALHDLRDDIKDGTLDGKKGAIAITTFTLPTPAVGQTYQAAMSAELNTLVTVAATAYATPGTAVPTVTMTVAELNVLLDAAMQVGAATQAASAGTAMTTATLNTQIANTVQTQVATLAVTGATAGTIQAGTAAAVAAGTAAGGVLAEGKAAATNLLADAVSGVYQVNVVLNAPAGTSINRANILKMTLTPQGTSYAKGGVRYEHNLGAWGISTQNVAGIKWDLTPTSPGGWVDTSLAGLNITVAADGTLTVHNLLPNGSEFGSSHSMLVTQFDLSGSAVEGCTAFAVGGPVPCTLPPYDTAKFPAGSKGYRFTHDINNQESYALDITGGAAAGTDMNGVALTALPALGDSFCLMTQQGAELYEPIVGAVAGARNYTQKSIGFVAGGCNAANIAAAVGNFANPHWLSFKDTNNAAAPKVLWISWGGCNNNGCDSEIVAHIPNKGVFKGWLQRQGPIKGDGGSPMTNRIAYDAMTNTAKAVSTVVGLGAAVPTIP
ncbi:MAG: hypothetical protein HOO97_07940 [Sideroxydans sp.]|nr:hypothetical protein [Sideroxydans sp.]